MHAYHTSYHTRKFQYRATRTYNLDGARDQTSMSGSVQGARAMPKKQPSLEHHTYRPDKALEPVLLGIYMPDTTVAKTT